jgi:hypothetical protein
MLLLGILNGSLNPLPCISCSAVCVWNARGVSSTRKPPPLPENRGGSKYSPQIILSETLQRTVTHVLEFCVVLGHKECVWKGFAWSTDQCQEPMLKARQDYLTAAGWLV